MNVIVFGATGGLGQEVWKRSVAAGHSVVAYVRSPGKLDASDSGYASLRVVQGDVMDGDAVRAAARGCEVAINCTSPAGGNSTLEIAQSLAGHAEVSKFYMVGGIGALWVPGSGRTVLVQDWDDEEAMRAYGMTRAMPREVIQKMTRGHLASMAFMAENGVPHTFICPGAMYDGALSSERRVTLDEVGGTSVLRVSFATVAQSLVDDLPVGAFLGHRVSVSETN
ncbi:MAG: NAD(P)H-binding protein [Myxococcota bacterium]